MAIISCFASLAVGCSSKTTTQLHRITKKISCKQYSSTTINPDHTYTNPLTYLRNYDEEYLSMKYAEKIVDVRQMLELTTAEGGTKQPLIKSMVMIDALQRLGIEHHFQDQIEAELSRLHVTFTSTSALDSQDLRQVSLCFRLLRQHGFQVNADVFNNFKNKEGKFIKKKLMKEDVRSVMELYEASQLRIHGEYTLDEAENLSTQILNEWMKQQNVDHDHLQAEMISNTLKHPHRKSLARFDTGFNNVFISRFPIPAGGNNNNHNTWENTLQQLSFVDSFISQNIRQMELHNISKWWNDDLGLAKEFKLARNQPKKWYIWSTAILSDMRLSDERIELTKSVALIYIIDDIFDLYGNPQDLALFTEAVNRWELEAAEQLPEYMKSSFSALYDFVNETALKIAKNHGSNPVISLQKAWASLCNAFLVEAKWFASKETPKAKEYLQNGILSSGVYVVLLHSFFLLGLGANTEKNTILSSPDGSGIISSAATILRLWDDLGSAQDEGQEGHDGSYINYFMKEQHTGFSVETAREHVIQVISNEWKQLNRECLYLNRSTASFQKCALNLARMVPLMYDYDNQGNLPFLEKYMKSMFYDINSEDP